MLRPFRCFKKVSKTVIQEDWNTVFKSLVSIMASIVTKNTSKTKTLDKQKFEPRISFYGEWGGSGTRKITTIADVHIVSFLKFKKSLWYGSGSSKNSTGVCFQFCFGFFCLICMFTFYQSWEKSWYLWPHRSWRDVSQTRKHGSGSKFIWSVNVYCCYSFYQSKN